MATEYLSGYLIAGEYKETMRREFNNPETGKTDITHKFLVYVHQKNGLVKDVEIKLPDPHPQQSLTPDTFYIFEVLQPRPARDGKTIYYSLMPGSEPIPSPKRR